ncbi:hypothetical protein AHAS_Ahas11G0161000 [Arachis hypogaea]
MKRLMHYNLGFVALGYLTISFVESIWLLLEYMHRKLKVSNYEPDNWIGKAAYSSSHFFLRYIGWIIKSVNQNAFIIIAITGESFFRSYNITT